MEELKLNILPNEDGEIIFRSGSAATIKERKSVSLSGTIDSVLDFEEKRKGEIQSEKAHVIIDRKNGKVIFNTEEDFDLGYCITGTMILHDYIKQLKINEAATFSIQQVINLLKMNRRFFSSRDAHATMLSSLTNFQARTEIDFTKADDFKGSVANSKIVKVKHEIPLSFDMFISVFEGEEPQKFLVDIEVTPDGGSLVCSFVSVDLVEIIEKTKDDTMKNVREKLSGYPLIIQ